jgi:hypothetical protein
MSNDQIQNPEDQRAGWTLHLSPSDDVIEEARAAIQQAEQVLKDAKDGSIEDLLLVPWGDHEMAVDPETMLWLVKQESIDDPLQTDFVPLIQKHQEQLTFDFTRGCLTRKN